MRCCSCGEEFALDELTTEQRCYSCDNPGEGAIDLAAMVREVASVAASSLQRLWDRPADAKAAITEGVIQQTAQERGTTTSAVRDELLVRQYGRPKKPKPSA